MFKRVLVPLDGSELAETALPYAVELVKTFKGELFLLQATARDIDIVKVSAGGMDAALGVAISAEEALRAADELRMEARRYLDQAQKRLAAQGIAVHSEVVAGDPAQAIAEFSRANRIDLVIMCTHGRGGLKRLVLGSVADKVMRDPATPVLVVQPK
ncbi:MAG: universal stress protein [Chloroflexi bacterium]|nr:universal stress protein [Chloroflexota bacterium]